MKKNSMEWKLKTVKLKDIKEYEANPRKITKKGLSDLKQSLKNFGQAEPLVVNEDMTLVGGHARKLAMESLGFDTCKVYIPTKKLTDKQVQELNVRLNKNIAGEFDFDKLFEFFEEDDLIEWGFDELSNKQQKTFEDEFNEIKNDDAEMPITPRYYEKYKAFVIYTDNEIDEINMYALLGLEATKSGKNGGERKTYVTTYKEFKKRWDAK